MIKLKRIITEASSPLEKIKSKELNGLRSNIASYVKYHFNMSVTTNDIRAKVEGNKLIFEFPNEVKDDWIGKFSVELSDKDLGKFVQSAKDAGIDTEWRGNAFVYSKDPKKLSDFFLKQGVRHMILKNGKGIKVKEKD